MTKNLTVAAKKRVPSRQGNRELENERQVLGVVYGHGLESVPVSVDASDILRAYRKVGNSTLIDLDIDGKKTTVLLKDVNLHPVRHEINHIDFFAVNLKERTTISVAIEFVGVSEAVKSQGGTFVTSHRTLEIKCLPSDSPHHFEVDKSALENIGDIVTIADLKLDLDKYELVSLDESETLCSVIAQRVQEDKDIDEEGEGEDQEEAAEEKTES